MRDAHRREPWVARRSRRLNSLLKTVEAAAGRAVETTVETVVEAPVETVVVRTVTQNHPRIRAWGPRAQSLPLKSRLHFHRDRKSCFAVPSASGVSEPRANPLAPRPVTAAPRPTCEKDIEAETNRSINESQRNFDALIRELRAISEPRAPYHPELSLEDELEQTYEALQHTQTDLERSRATIHGAKTNLRGKDREVRLAKQDLMAAESAAAR